MRCFTGLASPVSIRCSKASKLPKSRSLFANTSANSVKSCVASSRTSGGACSRTSSSNPHECVAWPRNSLRFHPSDGERPALYLRRVGSSRQLLSSFKNMTPLCHVDKRDFTRIPRFFKGTRWEHTGSKVINRFEDKIGQLLRY